MALLAESGWEFIVNQNEQTATPPNGKPIDMEMVNNILETTETRSVRPFYPNE
jgi:hypothetical protein